MLTTRINVLGSSVIKSDIATREIAAFFAVQSADGEIKPQIEIRNFELYEENREMVNSDFEEFKNYINEVYK